MTLTISPIVEAKLRERATAEGRDLNAVAEEILLEGLKWEFDPAEEENWRRVLERRIAEMDSGKVQGIPAAEVHEYVREKLR